MIVQRRIAALDLQGKVPAKRSRHLHTADFNLDEDALPLGAAMLAATAMRLMARGV